MFSFQWRNKFLCIIETPQFVCVFSKRKRESVALTFDETERRALLHKNWSRYKLNQFVSEMSVVSRVLESQRRALQELRNESEELYQQAIQVRLRICCTLLH